MARRNGSAISALRNMQFNLTGKPMQRSVVPRSTHVTVAPSSLGNIYMHEIKLLAVYVQWVDLILNSDDL